MIDLEKEREVFDKEFGVAEFNMFASNDENLEQSMALKCNWLGWKACAEKKQAEINELKAKLEKTCKWSPDEDLNWWTQCGNGFVVGDDPHPTSHNFKHCCYCGGVIEAAQGEGHE